MKVLKIIGGIFLLLIILFFLTGVIWPTFTYESQVTVNASPERSWNVFNDAELMPEWIQGFKSIKPISKEPGEVGSKYELIILENGEEMRLYETITAFDVNREFKMTVTNDVLDNYVEVTFTPDGDNTVIKASSYVDGKGLFWKSMLFVAKSVIQQTSDEQYEKLKELIEAKE